MCHVQRYDRENSVVEVQDIVITKLRPTQRHTQLN